MQLFPAIDLRGGKVVRLTQGDYDRMTVYGEDPCAQARQFLAAGAKNLHVVDLDVVIMSVDFQRVIFHFLFWVVLFRRRVLSPVGKLG